MDIHLKTSSYHGWQYAVSVYFTFLMIPVIIVAIQYFDPDQSWLWNVGFGAFFLISIYPFMINRRRIHNQIVQVIVNGTSVWGRTVFGKETSFDIQDIRFIHRQPRTHDLILIDYDGNRFMFNSEMDYLGFLYDYILINNIEIEYDGKYVEFLRNQKDGYWRYTRAHPFETEYEPEFLRDFLRLLYSQKKEMIKHGFLEADRFYGDNRDPFVDRMPEFKERAAGVGMS